MEFWMSTTDAMLGDHVEPLARLVRGSVTTARDPEWDLRRRGFNVTVEVEPYAIVEVTDVADVQACVRYAAEHGLAVTAQPSGHGVTTALTGAIVLRTAALQELTIDVDRRTARIGAGVKWQRVNEALTGTGLTGLPGSTGDVSVVGYSTGGGLSWFGRKYGFAAERILAIDLVTADGELVTATAAHEPDLFWALRGGGGDFGIITAVEIELVPLEQLYGGRMVWGGEHAEAVLTAVADFVPTTPDELSVWTWVMNLPDLEMVPPPLRGKRTMAIDVTHLGSAEEAEALLEPLLHRLPPPLLDTRGMIPLSALGDICAEPTTPVPVLENSMLLTRFEAEDARALLDALDTGRPSALTMLEVRQLGGALAEERPGRGAMAPVREAYAVMMVAMTPVPELAVAAQAEMVTVRAALAAVDSGKQMPNFGPLAEGNYSAETLARLAGVKRQVDPNGIIRSNRPVPLG
jgi:FAD/FMN-containing dehydrogenase